MHKKQLQAWKKITTHHFPLHFYRPEAKLKPLLPLTSHPGSKWEVTQPQSIDFQSITKWKLPTEKRELPTSARTTYLGTKRITISTILIFTFYF